MARRGKVYIIGVGPGSPDLLTLRAVERLREAEVVVYGNLVPEEIVNRFAVNAREKIRVTKRHRKDALKIVIEKALEGFIVAHLKNGDPTIYSNLRDEIEELEKLGIPYEIVPGVSSITAACVEAKIPLTDFLRGLRGFAVVDGHDEDVDRMVRLARELGMLVILMPSFEKVRKVLDILGQEFDVRVVQNASLPTARVLHHVPDVYDAPSIVLIFRRA